MSFIITPKKIGMLWFNLIFASICFFLIPYFFLVHVYFFFLLYVFLLLYVHFSSLYIFIYFLYVLYILLIRLSSSTTLINARFLKLLCIANFIVFFLFAGQLELKLTTKSRLGTDIKLEYLRNTSILNHWNETIWSKIIIRCNTYKSFTRSILLKYFKRFIFDIYIFKYSNKKCLFLNEESHNTNVLFNGIRCTFIRLIYSSISRE